MKSTAPKVLAALLIASCSAQQEEDRTRQLWDTNLLTQRPSGKKAIPAKPAAKVDGDLIGVTVWRLRPSKPSDPVAVRSLIHESVGSQEMTPERVLADTALGEGQHVRITIETARTGYIYVIDRDEYADSSKGEPALIFPTKRMRGGQNRVTGGTLVEIPSPGDTPDYLTVHRSRDDQTSESLLVLVSSQPIPGIETTGESQKLSPQQVDEWQKKWKTAVQSLEVKAEAGKPLTLAEKKAGAGGSRLTADDPLPQTMYRVETKPGAPLLIEIPLHIAR